MRPTTRLETPTAPRKPRTAAEIRQRIGANIAIAHDASGLSVADVAFDMRVERSVFSRWRRGLQRPDDVHLDELAVIYGRPFGWFFDEHDSTDEGDLTVAA